MKWLLPIFCPPTGTFGGITRILAVAEAAQAAGHELAFCASGEQAAALTGQGYRVYPQPPTTLFGLPEPLARIPEYMAQRVTPPVRNGMGDIWIVLTITGYARTSYLQRVTAGVLAAIRDFGPDVLFTDLAPEAFLAAQLTGLPIACAYQGIIATEPGSWAWQRMQRALTGALAAFGAPPLTPEALFYGPRTLKIIPSIPALDGTDPTRPDVRYVGSLLGDLTGPGAVGFQPEPDQRYVYAYLGTGSVRLGKAQRVLPEVFPAGGGTTCLVGSQSIQTTQRRGNVEFRHFVPAPEVLPYCDWTICHGGQNTIVESCLHGVPLLIFPGPLFERRFNAERVQAAGAGLLGEAVDFTPEWFARAFARHDELAVQAATLGDEVRALGGAPAAVQAVVEVVQAGEPVPA